MAERRRRARAKGQAPHIVTEPTREGSPCWKAEAERSTEAIIIISISGSGDTDSLSGVFLLYVILNSVSTVVVERSTVL